jgi:signal peptidase
VTSTVDAAAPDAPVRRVLRAVPTVLLYAAALVAVWFLWPSSLGGCTTLTIVSGHSMEPTYYTGDVVVARCGQPQVGDVVVYQPAEMGGARIIHRIIGGDGATGWTMQGDNNGFVDPFTPTEDEVVGVATLHLPKVGLAASALTNPWIWASLIVIALGILLWPSAVEEPERLDRPVASDEPDAPDEPGTLDGSPS